MKHEVNLHKRKDLFALTIILFSVLESTSATTSGSIISVSQDFLGAPQNGCAANQALTSVIRPSPTSLGKKSDSKK